MSNVLKFTNKPKWRHLGRVGERTAVIISDAENFPKFFLTFDSDKEYSKTIRNEKYPELGDADFLEVIADGIVSGDDHFIKEGNEYTSCIKNNNYTGYQVPLESSDCAVAVLGRVIDKPANVSLKVKEVLTHIFVFWDYFFASDFIDSINKGYEFKKTKVCSIDIYSGDIGIGLDNNWFYEQLPLARAESIWHCYLGNGSYDIFQIDIEKKIIPQNKDALQLDRKNFGTLVELNAKENFTIEDVSEILSKILSSPYGM